MLTSNKPKKVLKCTTSADLVATLPVMLGYHVQNSLVLVLFEKNRTSGAIRLDLPKDDYPKSELFETINELVPKLQTVTGVALVIYTDDSFSESGGTPLLQLVREVLTLFEDLDYEVKDAICVASDAWASYLDESPSSLGRALNEIEDNSLGFEARLTLNKEISGLRELAILPLADNQIQSELAPYIEQSRPYLSNQSILKEDMANIARATNSVLASGTCAKEAKNCALLAINLKFPLAWISALTAIALDKTAAYEMILSFTEPEIEVLRDITPRSETNPGRSLSDILIAFSAQKIDRGVLDRTVEVFGSLASNLDDGYRPPILAMLAWVWWMNGISTVATQVLAPVESASTNTIVSEVLKVINSGPPLWIYREHES